MNKIPLVALLIAVAGVSHADLRSDIETSRRKLDKAVIAKDVKGAEAIYKDTVTPDFKYVHAGKPEDFKRFLDDFKATIAMTEKVSSSDTRILSLKEKGDKASGEIELSMTGIMKTPDKKLHPIVYTGVFAEEFRKIAGKWKLATMTEGKQKFLMDGKPVKM